MRFCHGSSYDEITDSQNFDYEVMSILEDGKIAIAETKFSFEQRKNPQLQSTPQAERLYKIQSHGLRNGDIVVLPVKRKRRKKDEYQPPETPEKWVVVDASEVDEIAIVRYSSGFENLEDFTRSDSLTWSYRRPHEVRSTGDDIFSYREKVQAVAEAMRQQHDLALTPTSHRYVENLDLDNLLATAIQYFESKGYQANFAGYLSSEGSWQICIFHKNGDLIGSLLIDALPNFDDPNQNCPWLGGYKDLYWRPDEELEDEIYERDLVSDLEKLTAPLEVSEPKPDPELEKEWQSLEPEPAPEPDPFQHDAWLDDKPGIDNNDRDPFEGKVSEGFGLFALT